MLPCMLYDEKHWVTTLPKMEIPPIGSEIALHPRPAPHEPSTEKVYKVIKIVFFCDQDKGQDYSYECSHAVLYCEEVK